MACLNYGTVSLPKGLREIVIPRRARIFISSRVCARPRDARGKARRGLLCILPYGGNYT